MKRIKSFVIAVIFSLLISLIVYVINRDLGNDVIICLKISLYIFVDIMIGWISYFTGWDFFNGRWTPKIKNIINDQENQIEYTSFKIPLTEKTELNIDFNEIFTTEKISKQQKYNSKQINHEKLNQKLLIDSFFPMESNENNINNRELVIFCHGMKNSSKRIQYYTLPLVLNDYIVFSYDARGTGRKKMGKLSDFIERNSDLNRLLEIIYSNSYFENSKIHLVGESMGAIACVNAWKNFHEMLSSITLISVNSRFNSILKRWFIPFSKKWFYKLAFLIKGIKFNLEENENFELSPALIFEDLHKKYDNSKNVDTLNHTNNEKWIQLCKNIQLIHSNNDIIFDQMHLKEIYKEIGEYGAKIIEFKKGGHNQINNELSIISAIIKFIKKN